MSVGCSQNLLVGQTHLQPWLRSGSRVFDVDVRPRAESEVSLPPIVHANKSNFEFLAVSVSEPIEFDPHLR